MTAFAPRWKPWRLCRVREPLSLDQNIIDFLSPRRQPADSPATTSAGTDTPTDATSMREGKGRHER